MVAGNGLDAGILDIIMKGRRIIAVFS